MSHPPRRSPVSLHGSLETFALPDVLALLSSTAKTGELRVVGDRVQGSVWVERGQLVATQVGRGSDHVDSLFELLRLTDGMFTFEQNSQPAKPEPPVGLDALLVQAQERLVEWRGIEQVVPSTEASLQLRPAVTDDVLLTPEQWQVLVAAVEGATVDAVAERLGFGEFEACRPVRDLVVAGLPTARDATPATAPAGRTRADGLDPPR